MRGTVALSRRLTPRMPIRVHQRCVCRPGYHSSAYSGNTSPIEEQTVPYYHRKQYYPVRTDDTFNNRYKVLAKLGYGGYSTVWLARDLLSQQYTTLKVCIRDETPESPVSTEVATMRRMKEVAEQEEHPGSYFTRFASDIFGIDGPFGRHYCIAMKPQGSSLRSLQHFFHNGVVPEIVLRPIIHRLLFSVNFLHAACGLVHTDITPANVLMQAEDDGIFKRLEDYEAQNPSVPIETDRGPIYRSLGGVLDIGNKPVLTDFGKVCPADPPSKGRSMPDMYRAPEVLMGLPWSHEVDMWSIGVMTLELLEGKNLFDPIDRVHDQYVLPLALAQYISILGHPPKAMAKHDQLISTYFDDEGIWASEPAIPSASLDDFVTSFAPGKRRDLFLKFIRRLLTWDPDLRATAFDLIEDEWLVLPWDEALHRAPSTRSGE